MLSSAKVLIVDDSPGDVRLAGRALRVAGDARFTLRSADTLAAATATLESTVVDLVVLDLGLPEVQGVQSLKRLLPHTHGVPVVVVTGMEDEALGVECLDLGAEDYLTKDRLGSDLLRTVEFSLRRRRQLERRFTALVDSLHGGITSLSPTDPMADNFLAAELEEFKKLLMNAEERDVSARRIETLANRLADRGLSPLALLEWAQASNAVVWSPTARLLMVALSTLGETYLRRQH